MNIPLLKNVRFAIAILVLSLQLLQGCGDDKADPVAHHVKVKCLHINCIRPVLQILDQRYAAFGQKGYLDPETYGKYTSAVLVTDGTVNWSDLKEGQVYYVDITRNETQPQGICTNVPYHPLLPSVWVSLVRIY